MMSSLRRTATAIGASAAVVIGALAGASPATARTEPVVATYTPPPGNYALQAGLRTMWTANVDEFHDAKVYRLDPSSRRMTLVASLPFPGGGMTIAFGSIWISDYFGNAVWRLAPNGHVQAKIATGLQPQWIHAAFGSLWVSDHHGAALSRINPRTDRVRDTVQVGAPDTFRNGPQDVTDDGTNVYVVSSNLQALQAVDPATDAVTTPATIDDQFCGPITAIAGFVWSVDPCTGTTYRLATDGTVQQAIASTGIPGSLATRRGTIWIGDDTTVDPDTGRSSHAVLEQRDPRTGALLRTVTIGGDAFALAAGFGDLWVYDANNNTIRRVHV